MTIAILLKLKSKKDLASASLLRAAHHSTARDEHEFGAAVTD
jgi:hypothetical protein